METLVLMHFLSRKLAHFVEYAILGFLSVRAFSGSPTTSIRTRWFAISAGLIVLYALIDEYRQSFVPSRTASFFDSLIDMSGGMTALIIFRRLGRTKRSR
jgi:VanZ family protein